MTTDRRKRPSFGRWLKATFGTWFAAPLFAPFMWQFLMVEGINGQALLIVAFWTYFIGLPLASVGVVALLIMSVIWFERVAAWQWWTWAIIGAAIGFAIIAVIFRLDVRGRPLDEPGLLMLATGPVPGFASALIFRRLLLGRSA